jgi:hypothetical protein
MEGEETLNGTIRLVAVCAILWPMHSTGQETRGMIFGRVLDPQSAPVAGSVVTVTNTDTGLSSGLMTNASGYYEAQLLLPGKYAVAAESQGFKKAIRSGIELAVAARLQIDLQLQLGAVTESINLSAEAPLLETNSVSTGRTISQRAIRELPMMGGQATLLVQLTPGMYHPGQVTYTVPGFNRGREM